MTFITSSEKIFTQSSRIYINDTGFARLNNQYTEFIDFFDTARLSGSQSSSTGGKIILNIHADSNYTLYINGAPVSFGTYASSPDAPIYDSIDITAFTNFDEQNKIAILLYYSGKESTTYLRGTPGLIFEIKYYPPNDSVGLLLLASSNETLSRIAPEYSCGDIPLESPETGYTFEFDSATYDNWEKTDYQINRNMRSRHCWLYSAVLDDSRNYSPRPIKKQVLYSVENDASPKIVAQGIFDYGNEYRTGHTKTPAQYMQNAALKSKRIATNINDTSSMPVPSIGVLPCKLSYSFSQDNHGTALCGKGVFALIDLTTVKSGFLSLDMEAPAGTLVTIGYGNDISNLRLCTASDGNNFSCSYICNGSRSTFTHFIHRITGRYLQIFAECDSISIYSATILPVMYHIRDTLSTEFCYSDALHSKIHDVAVASLRRCMHDYYEKEPHHNRASYIQTARNQMLGGYYAFGEFTLAKENLRLFASGLRSDGLLELCTPGHTTAFPQSGTLPITAPSFSLYWILALAEYALYSGDLQFFFDMLPVAESIMKNFTLHSMPGKALLMWGSEQYINYHEDTTGLNGNLAKDIITPKGNCYDANLTALFITALERLAQTYAFMAMTDGFMDSLNSEHLKKANSYMDLCETMRSQFNNIFFNETVGLYASYTIGTEYHDYSELTNAMAIYCGACKGQLQKMISQALINGGNDNVSLNKISPELAIYKYEALLLENMSNIDFIMNDIELIWGNALFSGCVDFQASACTPLLVYYKYILGLRPLRPGFAEYSCLPRQYKCHEVSGCVITPAGKFVITSSKDHYNCKLHSAV